MAIGTAVNCLVISNTANNGGGGAYASYLTNSTIVGNLAPRGREGAVLGGLANSIVYFNTASDSPDYDSGAVLNDCCATPVPENGVGNIAGPPLFVDETLADLHLQSASPCINSGNNGCVSTATDMDGLPRIVGGAVDIGTYEFQSPSSVISFAWLQQYGLSTDGSADYADSDADGLNNWQEWVADTNPTNAASNLRIVGASHTNSATTVTWQSVSTRSYSVERSSQLSSSGTSFSAVATKVPGLADVTSYTDTNATTAGPFFYRVVVRQ